MDTSDSKIVFDEKGMCDHCHNFYENILPNWHTDETGMAELEKQVAQIKRPGRGKSMTVL